MRRLVRHRCDVLLHTAQSDAVDDRLHAMSIKQLRWLGEISARSTSCPFRASSWRRAPRHRTCRPRVCEQKSRRSAKQSSQRQFWAYFEQSPGYGTPRGVHVLGRAHISGDTKRKARIRRLRRGEKTLGNMQISSAGRSSRRLLVLVTGVIDLLLCWVRLIGDHWQWHLAIQASETSRSRSRRCASTRPWPWSSLCDFCDQTSPRCSPSVLGRTRYAQLGIRSRGLMAARHRAPPAPTTRSQPCCRQQRRERPVDEPRSRGRPTIAAKPVSSARRVLPPLLELRDEGSTPRRRRRRPAGPVRFRV